ncbi:UNVERIFIED_ORG: DTW domain-containing protein YfiP [Atlantibacter sp. SORGH_AS 304]|nr:DTW domain-containing protein YfiP [Atlantibacter sp. SORGH_AS_0304]
MAIALLDLAGDNAAAQALGDHFTLFRERYLAGKPHHSFTVTAKAEESV